MLLLERYRLSPTNNLASYLPSSIIIDFLLRISLSGVVQNKEYHDCLFLHTYFVLKYQPFILFVLKKGTLLNKNWLILIIKLMAIKYNKNGN